MSGRRGTSAADGFFVRSAALLGADALSRLSRARVLVVGVGGVGSWCAEALVRTGLGAVALMDDDLVAASNVNRQCPATSLTVGASKVEAMKERIIAVNPECRVDTASARFEDFSSVGAMGEFDLVVDAIDSVPCKAELILGATERGIPVVSSMGAALRTDPTKVCVRRFDKVEGDGLARALRQRFKRLGRFPAAPFRCVCSTEPPAALPPGAEKGSLMTVTATFGMCLAAEALKILGAEGGLNLV